LVNSSVSTPQPSCLNQPVDDATTAAAVCGAFYGVTQPAAAIEGLIAAHVPRKQITDVADIYERRWWDYRRLTPGHSFYLFAESYYRACRTAAKKLISERARNVDKSGRSIFGLEGPALVQMTADGIFDRDKAHITGIWKAMLVADALGMPYSEFCRLACKVAIERLWSRLPRPTQLYSENLAVFVMDEWDALRKSKFVAAQHPVYAVENYDGRRMQDAYREYVIEQIKQIDGKVPALASALYFRPQLPLDLAQQHFPQQILDRAYDLAH
jgi:hypothetical protein